VFAVPVEAVEHQDRVVTEHVRAGVGDGHAAAPCERVRDGLPTDHVPLVGRRAWELGDRDAAIGVEYMRLGPRAAQRAAAALERDEVLCGRLLAFQSFGGRQQLRQLEQRGNAGHVVGQVRAAVRIVEAQRALAQVVADVEQVVDLAEAALGRALLVRAAPLAALHELSSPAIRGTVGERAEQRTADRCLLLAGHKRQRRVELVCVGSRLRRPPCQPSLLISLTDDDELRREGEVDEASGTVKEKVGEAADR